MKWVVCVRRNGGPLLEELICCSELENKSPAAHGTIAIDRVMEWLD